MRMSRMEVDREASPEQEFTNTQRQDAILVSEETWIKNCPEGNFPRKKWKRAGAEAIEGDSIAERVWQRRKQAVRQLPTRVWIMWMTAFCLAMI